MRFCRRDLVRVYRRFGFVEITSPVWADQPGGRIEMPLVAMWRALRSGTRWPPGRVDVRGCRSRTMTLVTGDDVYPREAATLLRRRTPVPVVATARPSGG